MPVPSRKARDETAATKPPCVVGGRFCRGRPFFGRAGVCSIQYQFESPLDSDLVCLPQARMLSSHQLAMANSAYAEELSIPSSASLDSPRHSAVVRITHWITAVTFVGLLYSGVMILIAHPRLYWGETGALGTPSLIDLPFSFTIGHSGWGRFLHFLS